MEIHPNVTYVSGMCLYGQLSAKVFITLEQVITSVVEKKRIILMIKTSRFTGKSGSRIEDWLEKIVDRGDMGRRL